MQPTHQRTCPHTHQRTGRTHQRGASLTEFIIVFPVFLMLTLGIIQTGLAFHAKSNLNLAAHEAARAGSVENAQIGSFLPLPSGITGALGRALVPYYGGGQNSAELSQRYGQVVADLTVGNGGAPAYRIEILSPTRQSFDDYASSYEAQKLNINARVIPNAGIGHLSCPRDNPGCNSDPRTNKSGQNLLDANLLKLRITYGIPPSKQIPMVGRFYTWSLQQLGSAGGDVFVQSLLQSRRIPVVVHTTVRMMSEPIENPLMASLPGAGNNGNPQDPGPPIAGNPLPACPFYDPTCVICPEGVGQGVCAPAKCDPTTDPNNCRPPGCEKGDIKCDPGCRTGGVAGYCCLPTT
jgi:hypothetical protein